MALPTYKKNILPGAPNTQGTSTQPAASPSSTSSPAPSAAPSGQVKWRDYLINQGGYKPSDIGVSNGNVTLQGAFFGRSNPNADGYNYGTESELANRLQSFRGTQQQNQLNTTNSNLYNAVNAPAKTFSAYKPFEYTQENIMNDPQYQAAAAMAKQNIQTGQNNTLANLVANGQGNSSYAATVAQQIANKEMGNLNYNLVPQIIRDAYQRNLDTFNANNQVEQQDYGAGQDRIKNMSGLSSQIGDDLQRAWQNRFNYGQAIGQFGNGQQTLAAKGQAFDQGMANKQFNRGVLESDRAYNYQVGRDKVADSQWQQEFDYNKVMNNRKLAQDAQQFAASQGLQWANLSQRQKEFAAQQAWQKKQYDDDQAWKQKDYELQFKKLKPEEAAGGIDDYDLRTLENTFTDSGLSFNTASPDDIKDFVSSLKAQYGWDTEEAKKVETYLSSKTYNERYVKGTIGMGIKG